VIPLLIFLVSFVESKFPDIARFAFETYYNFRDFGQLDRSSQLILYEEELETSNHNLVRTFFGSGNYNVELDMGYRVMYAGGGYIGILFSFGFLIPTIFFKSNFYYRSINFKLISFTFFFIFFIVNFKNVYFFGYNDIFQIYFLLINTAILCSDIVSNKTKQLF
jgi:hypothetical protein